MPKQFERESIGSRRAVPETSRSWPPYENRLYNLKSPAVRARSIQLGVLRLGFPQDGDVGVGVFLWVKKRSLWQAHALQQVDVARIGAERLLTLMCGTSQALRDREYSHVGRRTRSTLLIDRPNEVVVSLPCSYVHVQVGGSRNLRYLLERTVFLRTTDFIAHDNDL
jgi:hypothetical protein